MEVGREARFVTVCGIFPLFVKGPYPSRPDWRGRGPHCLSSPLPSSCPPPNAKLSRLRIGRRIFALCVGLRASQPISLERQQVGSNGGWTKPRALPRAPLWKLYPAFFLAKTVRGSSYRTWPSNFSRLFSSPHADGGAGKRSRLHAGVRPFAQIGEQRLCLPLAPSSQFTPGSFTGKRRSGKPADNISAAASGGASTMIALSRP